MPSNDPRKKAKKVTSAQSWKKSTNSMDLELPSGNVCRVKRPGLPQLLEANILPDMLTSIAQKAIDTGRSGVAIADVEATNLSQEVLSKEGGMAVLMESVARITAYCVVEPKVLYHKQVRAAGQIDQIQESYLPKWELIPEDERNDEVLYTDEVDFEDMLFIFNFVVGGSADLVEFRKQLGESLDSVADEPGAKEDAS